MVWAKITDSSLTSPGVRLLNGCIDCLYAVLVLGSLPAFPREAGSTRLFFIIEHRIIPTATLLEHTLLAQGFMGVQKAAFPRHLRP